MLRVRLHHDPTESCYKRGIAGTSGVARGADAWGLTDRLRSESRNGKLWMLAVFLSVRAARSSCLRFVDRGAQ